jgi:hypothetical protein
MTTYGYAWVSTDAQTFDAQVAALKAAGAERIFSEKQSGDRLARSTRDLLNVQARLAGIMLNEQPNYEMVGPSK